MKRLARAAAAASVTLGAALALAGGAALAAPPVQGLIVRLKDAPAHDDGRRSALAAQTDLRWRQALSRAGLAGARSLPVGRDQRRLLFDRPLSATEARRWRQRLLQDPAVDWVEPNTLEQRLQVPSDPLYAPQQWWLQPAGGSNANAIDDRRRGAPGFQTAWASGLPGASGRAAAAVAVLDTGITAHPELLGHLLPGHDFVSEPAFANDGDGRDADPADPGDWVDAADLADPRFAGCAVTASSWHGSIVAGMLAARTDDGIGVAALHWDSRVLPVRVAGKCGATVADIVDGMRWAAGLPVAGVPANPFPVRIVNVSFGGDLACGPAYQAAVDELQAAGVLVVAAAGNGHGAATRPANCTGVVGVVALNRDGFKTTYSSFGPELAASGLATVGGDDAGGAWGALLADPGVFTLWNDGRRGPGLATHAHLFGSSFAAPSVAGAASLMLSVNPALSVDDLRRGLGLSARPHVVSDVVGACSAANPGRCLCSPASCGRGILDVPQALQFAAAPQSYVAPVRLPENIDSNEVLQAAALGPDRPGSLPTAPDTATGGGAFGPGWAAALAAVAALLRRRVRGRA